MATVETMHHHTGRAHTCVAAFCIMAVMTATVVTGMPVAENGQAVTGPPVVGGVLDVSGTRVVEGENAVTGTPVHAVDGLILDYGNNAVLDTGVKISNSNTRRPAGNNAAFPSHTNNMFSSYPADTARPSDGPHLFERMGSLLGDMVGSFFSALTGNLEQGENWEDRTPLVAVDTWRGPTIHIPGILGLNTGDTRRQGGGPSLVSVSNDQGTRVNIPGIFDMDVGGLSPPVEASRPHMVSVYSSVGQRPRIRTPFFDIFSRPQLNPVRISPNPANTKDQDDTDWLSLSKSIYSPLRTFNFDTPNSPPQFILDSLFLSAIRRTRSDPHLTSSSVKTKQSFYSSQSSLLVTSTPAPMRFSSSWRRNPVNELPSKSHGDQDNYNIKGKYRRVNTENNNKKIVGLHDYKSHRIDHRLVPNYFKHMNPNPNDIPNYLIAKGVNTPHKMRTHIIDAAQRWINRAKKTANIDYTNMII